MSKDYIIDAFNDLDEDLITETAKCRCNYRSQYKRWMLPTTVAAVFGIVISVFFYSGGFDLFLQNNENGVAMEDSELHYSMQENIEVDPEFKEQLQELPSVIITLEDRNADGFTGVVTALTDTGALPLGSRVAVKVDSKTELLCSAFSTESNVENKVVADSSEAVTLRVVFSPWNVDDFSRFDDDTENVYHIYAEQILPVDKETQ